MGNTAQTDDRPLAVTMGCPAGIGPEIICRLFNRADAHRDGPAIVVGDPGMLGRAAEQLGITLELVSWRPGDPIRSGTLPVCQTTPFDSDAVTWGRPDAATGRAMAGWIEAASTTGATLATFWALAGPAPAGGGSGIGTVGSGMSCGTRGIRIAPSSSAIGLSSAHCSPGKPKRPRSARPHSFIWSTSWVSPSAACAHCMS